MHEWTSICIGESEWNEEMLRRCTGETVQLMCPERPSLALGSYTFWFKLLIIMYSAWFQHNDVLTLPSFKTMEPIGHKVKPPNPWIQINLPSFSCFTQVQLWRTKIGVSFPEMDYALWGFFAMCVKTEHEFIYYVKIILPVHYINMSK